MGSYWRSTRALLSCSLWVDICNCCFVLFGEINDDDNDDDYSLCVHPCNVPTVAVMCAVVLDGKWIPVRYSEGTLYRTYAILTLNPNTNLKPWCTMFKLLSHVLLGVVMYETRLIYVLLLLMYLQRPVTRVIKHVSRYGTPTCDNCIVNWLQEHWAEISCSLSAGFDCFFTIGY